MQFKRCHHQTQFVYTVYVLTKTVVADATCQSQKLTYDLYLADFIWPLKSFNKAIVSKLMY